VIVAGLRIDILQWRDEGGEQWRNDSAEMKIESIRTTSSLPTCFLHYYTSSLASSFLLSIPELLLNRPESAFSYSFPVFSPAKI
jgi:hypothetical protein